MKVVFLGLAQESLGIECLSASLRAAGFETALVVDPLLFEEPGFLRSPLLARVFDPRREVLAQLLDSRPGMVCLSVTTDYFAWARDWAALLKRHLDAPVVFGGMHPTSVPGRVARTEGVDYVCVGEGDEALVELAAALRDRGDPTRIRNIWARRGDTVIPNPLRPPVADLDCLPFPDKELYRRAHPIYDRGYLIATGRGCPFACAYCCNSVYGALYGPGRFLRRRSPAHVLAELAVARRLDPGFVHFVDEVFNQDAQWLAEFLPRYGRDIGLPFSCYVYPDLVSGGQARALRDAGCFKVQLGLQTGDEAKRREVFRRPSQDAAVARAIREFRAAGVYVAVDHILGLPGETDDDLAALLRFHEGSLPDSNEVFFLRCYPGSALTGWAQAQGHLDQAAVDAIADGASQDGLFGGSDLSGNSSRLRRAAALLSLYPLLPGPLRRAVLRWRLWRWLPVLPRVLVLIAARLWRHPAHDFNTGRAWDRFAYFLGRRWRHRMTTD